MIKIINLKFFFQKLSKLQYILVEYEKSKEQIRLMTKELNLKEQEILSLKEQEILSLKENKEGDNKKFKISLDEKK